MGSRTAAMITPVGGSLFLLGWLLFSISVIKTKNSIMNDYRKSEGKDFGPINEEIILKILEKYE